MVRRVASLVRQSALVVALGVIAVVPGSALAHPLHTSLVRVSHDAPNGRARIVMRVFADDFLAAAAGRAAGEDEIDPASVAGGALVRAYLNAHLRLTDARGRRVPLRWTGLRRTGAVLWLALDAPAPAGLAALTLRATLLCERFADQVNIVEVIDGSRRRSLLFTRATGGKPLA